MALPTLSSLLLGNQYIGVEHYTLGAEERLALLLVDKRKGALEVGVQDTVALQETLPEKWNKNLPFYLVINTSQIIQKEIEVVDVSAEKLVHKAFPNLVWADFYFEVWRLKTKSLVVISRKSYIDSVLDWYQKQGVSVLGFSLGVCAAEGISSFAENQSVATNTQQISWDEASAIVQSKETTFTASYMLNGLLIQHTHLLAFAGVLRLLLGWHATGNVAENNLNLLHHFQQKSWFRKSIRILVGTLLTILLVNFFVFNYYFKKSEETSTTLQLHQSSLEEANAVRARIKKKEEKVSTFTTLSSSKSSVIINEIASLVPSSVLLSELVFNPLEKKIKPEEPIVTIDKTLVVSGITLNNADFTRWISSLERLSKIKEVTILSFGKDENNETAFSIKITLK